MKRIAILLFFAVLACVAVGYNLLSSQQGASADPAPVSLDSVDIGKNEGQAGWACSAVYSSEETNHSAADWGISVWNACGGGYGFPSQSGDATARVLWQGQEWDSSGSQVDGTNNPGASVTLTNPSAYQLGTLVVEVLDGTAGSNAFDVIVNGTTVYTYYSSGTAADTWVIHSIDLANPANSSRNPAFSDSSVTTGTGINPCTTDLVVELVAHGPAWTYFYQWGQVAVTYLELFAAEPEAICEADLDKVSLSPVGISNGQDIPVSEDIWFQLEEVLHNIGPNPAVHAWSHTWATPPPGGEVSYHCQGGEIVTINGQVVQDSCPYSHVEVVGWPDVLDVHINVDLPISTPVPLLTDWDIHCLEPSTHTWHFENVVEAKDPLIIDPEPGNNAKYLDLTVDCIGTADVGIVSQQVNAPATVPVSEDVTVTLNKVLHNMGPWGPVDIQIGTVIDSVNIGYDGAANACNAAYSADEDAHAADGWGQEIVPECHGAYGGGSDDGNARVAWHPNELPSSANDTREASVTLTNPGFKLGILRTSVLDGQAGSNSFELRVNGTLVYTYHSDPSTAEFWVIHSIDLVNPGSSSFDVGSGSFTAGTGIDPFTDSLEIEFTVLGDKWSGFDTWGQLAVSWVELLAASPIQVDDLPVSDDVPQQEQLVIHCSEASTHVFPFVNKILKVKDAHVVDPDLGNNTMPGVITVDCIGTANPKIVSQQINAPSQVAVSENVPVTVSKVLHNNGPYGPVEVEVGAVIDSVNIGGRDTANQSDPACNAGYSDDETNHSADGWGQEIVPECHGAYGGGSDDGNARVAWHPNELPSSANDTREASVTLTNPGFQLGILRTSVLDGQAGSNSFELRVNGTLVYTYHSDPSTAEFWVVHSIDLVNPDNSSIDVGNGSFTAGTGIDPFTDSLEIEFTVLGDKWSGFDTWGQLAVSWVQLLAGDTYQEVIPLPTSTEVVVEEHLVIHCSEASTHTFEFVNTILRIKDEHVVDSDLGNNTMPGQITVDCIGTADVKITSVDIPDIASGEVSEDKSVTLGAEVHNNGPYGPVSTHMRLTLNVAPNCTLRVVFPGYPPIPVPSGVPIDAPIPHDLPVSGDLSLSVDLIGHCTVAGQRMFSGRAEIVIDQAHVVDPDPDNNEAYTEASWAVYGESDVKIVTQQFLTPPAEIDVSANVPVTLRKVLHNNGPYAEPVEVTVSKTATAPADCTINPATDEKQVVVPYGVDVTVDETFTIHCSKPSSHTFSVTNVVSEPKDPYVIDPDMGNNGPQTTSLTVKAIGYSDLKVAAQYMADPPAQIPVSQDVVVMLDKVIHNNGPWGPVDASTTTNVTVPTNCTVRPQVHTQQFSNVPVSVDILHHEPFVIHCYELGEYTFTFDDSVAVKEPHVRDPVPDNNDWDGTELTVEAMALADVKITSASLVNPPTKIPLGQDVDVTLRKHIHNNGPWTPVNIAINSTATPPTGCTVVAKNVPNSLSGVPVSVDQVVDEVWTINCTQDTTVKTFVFDSSIGVSTAHVYDPNAANNASKKYLTVSDDPADPQGDMDGDGWTNGAEAVIGTDPADACPDNPGDDAWPPDVNNDASVNILDVLSFKGPISGAYDCRYDLSANGVVNILDVLLYKQVIGMTCTR